jgi:hypothetical protein
VAWNWSKGTAGFARPCKWALHQACFAVIAQRAGVQFDPDIFRQHGLVQVEPGPGTVGGLELFRVFDDRLGDLVGGFFVQRRMCDQNGAKVRARGRGGLPLVLFRAIATGRQAVLFQNVHGGLRHIKENDVSGQRHFGDRRMALDHRVDIDVRIAVALLIATEI